ncbi:DsbA family oxidoreductase [Paenibacillus sp. BK720]|uniref:DsbA family oxidoreductase n=1 Tax=Paenibacillus sp. BK720 TaxID=2587092 RepID=UPI0014246394|nr:DsbA family oxidoreductase [Paenibacillus sp. BK720]NIK68345.1 putative DsbA family dithiol-disulfide isomerase [Paenibacillus sp. BK720]
MKVEIWSDIMCPFCYIGKRRFEAALQEFAHRDQVEVIHRSFELDPTSPLQTDKNYFEYTAAKYGISAETLAKQSRSVTERAKQEGLIFNYNTVKNANTHDAHRLLYFAREFGKEQELLELLYKAYFTESLPIGQHESLVSLAEQVGLDRQQASAMLAGTQNGEAVRNDQLLAARLGIQGVPYFLIDGRHAISGAQPASTMTQVLDSAWKEAKASRNQLDSDICNGGIC